MTTLVVAGLVAVAIWCVVAFVLAGAVGRAFARGEQPETAFGERRLVDTSWLVGPATSVEDQLPARRPAAF